MNKYLGVLIIIGLGFAGVASANQLFFFQNGNGYDISGQLQAMCFQNGACYDINGSHLSFSLTPQIIIVPTPLPNFNPPPPIVNTPANIPTAIVSIPAPKVSDPAPAPSCTLVAIQDLNPPPTYYGDGTLKPPRLGDATTLTWTANNIDVSTSTPGQLFESDANPPRWNLLFTLPLNSPTGSYSNQFNGASYKVMFADGTTCYSN